MNENRRSVTRPKPGTSAESLSELEGFVLGIAHDKGPCTGYQIRQRLAQSPSTQWSGSAGAVYPLVRKLVRLGLLKSVSAPQARGDQYIATPKGVDALRRWMGPPLPGVAQTVSYDPLRSRAAMLMVFSPKERRAWVKAALAALDALEAQVEAWHSGQPGPAAGLLTLAGRADIAARRSWIKRVAELLGERGPGKKDL
jgi:DNA-binding PadR family transcriptional regulator